MLVDGNADIGDLYGVFGDLKRAAVSTGKGAKTFVTKTVPNAASKTASFTVNKAAPFAGKVALAPFVLPTKAAIGVAKGVGGAAAGAAGTVLGAPIGIAKTVGSNLFAGLKAGAAGPGGSAPTPTQAAAAEVAAQQPQGSSYSSPGGGYSGGGGGGGGYESASSGLVDQGTGQAPAPEGMSTTTKIALAGGAVAVAYLLWSRSKKGRGGRRK